MMAIYFGFMGLFAFDKPLLGTILATGLSLCIVLGPLVIISSFLLCLVYRLWANRVFDAGIRELGRSRGPRRWATPPFPSASSSPSCCGRFSSRIALLG